MLLGHLVGDYLLQNNYMALNKGRNDLIGWFACLLHCTLYTLAITTIMWNFDWEWVLIVFISHFPIDKFSLASYYLKFIKDIDLYDYLHKDKSYNNTNKGDIIQGGFTTIVYVLTDNTLHLLLMWIGYNLIY